MLFSALGFCALNRYGKHALSEPLSCLASYQALRSHAAEVEAHTLRELFARAPHRFDTFSQQYKGLLFDYSKNRITEKTIDGLFALFSECEVDSWRDRMFAGECINSTEKRAVQHVALRDPDSSASTWVKQQHEVLQRMETFVTEAYAGGFTDVVNLGIGGSSLGPMLVCDALTDFAESGFRVHFVANVDATEMNRVLSKLNPATTLFVIVSKSFNTQETLTNANVAREWLAGHARLQNDPAKHFAAVSANVAKAVTFGIPSQRVFPIWDEVGGRFSLWSAAGLSIALYLGMSAFKELLRGAHAMDVHFKNASPRENIPVLLALLDLWNQHFLHAAVHVVLPYDVRLRYFPAYLQQLQMESNGKFVDRSGRKLEVPSSAAVFGDVGTNAQHSFFQLLHQGTHTVSCDFIGVVKAAHDNEQQHEMLLANMFGQARALMLGQTLEEARTRGDDELAAHKIFPGNRASNTILLEELTPYSLGVLLATCEHRVFVQGIILDINSFDQMGVELGKRLAKDILTRMQSREPVVDQDSSTNALLNFCKGIRR